MNNQTLAHIIEDRIESARNEMRRSRDEAAEAVINASERMKECRAVYEADKQNPIADLEYNLAIKECAALSEAWDVARRACDLLTYGAGDLSSRNNHTRYARKRLVAALEAAANQAA